MITSNLNHHDALTEALDRLGASLDTMADNVASMISVASQRLSGGPTSWTDEEREDEIRRLSDLPQPPPAGVGGGHDDQA